MPAHKTAAAAKRVTLPSRRGVAGAALLRAADLVRRRWAAAVEPFGITLQQYNVLRILRGALPEPLPTLEIAERMIEQTPGITRLLDRLEQQGWVARTRSAEDRRLVYVSITKSGIALVGAMDDAADVADEAALGDLSEQDVAALLRICQRIRAD